MTLNVAPPLSARLFTMLRQAIIIGQYPQGSQLHEARLAEEMKVSRVPVREAFPRLENEGFIESAPRRSAVVSTWTARRINDLFDTRLGLEVRAAGMAARRAHADGDLHELEATIAEAGRTLRTQSGDALLVAERQFAAHSALVAAAQNELMNSLMRVIGGRMTWLFYLTEERNTTYGSTKAQHEHELVLEAVRSGNDGLAEALTFAHIEAGRAPTLRALAS